MDNYIERKVFTEIEQNVEKRILPFRSCVKINSVISQKITNEVTASDYIQEEHFLIAIIIVDNEEAFENVDKILLDLKKDYPKLKIKSFTYLLEKEKFDDFIDDFKESIEITKAMVVKYLPKKEKILN